jgi:flagellar motor switch protein FliM
MSGLGATSQIARDSLAELFAGSSGFVERMPMLRVVFDRAAALCTESLAAVADPPPHLALQDVQSGTAGDLLDGYDGKSCVGMLHASRWNARLLVLADRAAVFTIVETMLGGDGSQPAYDMERAFSRIEVRIAETFFGRIAKALETALAGVADTPIAVEDTGDQIDYDAIGRNNPIVAAKLRLEAGDRGGDILIAIARAALNPLRRVLALTPTKQAPPSDPRWSEQIQSQVTRAHVVLSAVLDERPGTLAEVAGFEVGHIVELNATATGRVRLECNGERLMWCHLGKSQGRYTLRVDEPVDREQEFMNEILSS